MADSQNEQQKVREVTETVIVTAAEVSWPQTRAILRVIFIALAVAAIIFILYELTGVLLLVVLAIFFAYLIAPLVEMVRRGFSFRGRARVMPRALAIGIVYLVIFGSLFTIAYILMPRIGAQMAEFTRNAPEYLTNAKARAQRLDGLYDQLRLPPSIRRTANGAVDGTLAEAKKYLVGDQEGEGGEGVKSAIAALGYLPWLVLVPILAFFLLKDADNFRRSALQLLPQGRLRWRGDEFFQDVNSTLAAYIRAQLIACLLIGTVCTIGFMVIGVRYALVLGLIAGLLEFIPLVGPLTVLLIAVAVASFYSLNQVIAIIIFLFVLRIIHDYVTYPRIIGSGIHLHPLAVILAILSGHELAGIAGVFLAIPAIAILTVTYRHWLEHRGSEGLVADLLKPAEQSAAGAALPPNAAAPAPPPTSTPASTPATAQTTAPATVK